LVVATELGVAEAHAPDVVVDLFQAKPFACQSAADEDRSMVDPDATALTDPAHEEVTRVLRFGELLGVALAQLGHLIQTRPMIANESNTLFHR
jgi:hypothetical protein